MNKKPLRSILIIIGGVIILSILAACHTEKKNNINTLRSKEFRILYDSIKNFSPRSKDMADSLIRSSKDSTTFYAYTLLKGNWYILSDQLDSAKWCASQSLMFIKKQPSTPFNHAMIALAYSLQAACDHLVRKNTTQTIELYKKSLYHIMLSDQIDIAPDVAANLADAYIFQNDIPMAAKWYRRALFLVDSLKLPNERSISLYMGLGQIYTTLEDYNSAKKYYELTERQFNKMDPNIQAYFLNNYGNYFYFKGDYTHALSTFIRLKNHIEKAFGSENLTMYVCKVNLADTYLNLGQLDKAKQYVNESATNFNKIRMNEGIYYANTIKIGIALKEKQYDRIDSILKHEKPMANIDQNMLNIRSRYLIDYYANTGQYHKAFETQTLNRQQLDSTEHNKQNMRASEIMSRFTEDTLRLHYELVLHERNAVVNKSRATLWALLCFISILILGIVTIAFYLRKRRLQTDLDMFVLRLAAIRQRISPHFVFNVLNAKISHAPQDESDVLINMSKLIRQNLNLSGQTYVSLTEELTFVKRYVELQRTLIGDSLEFSLKTPSQEVLDSITIPSMFVQILVENAIKHGLKSIKGEKRLSIEVRHDEKETIISVTDNGPGFDIRRQNANSTKTGLYVIRNTMAVMNKKNKPEGRMKLRIHNLENEDGTILGCQTLLYIPNCMKMIIKEE